MKIPSNMQKKTLKDNMFFIFLHVVVDFFVSLAQSLWLFIENIVGKKPKVLRENSFLGIMNFFFHIGPKSFWKAPSGIKIGRSIGTFLHYIFQKERVFTEKKK